MISSFPVLLTILSIATFQVGASSFCQDGHQDQKINLAKFISNGKPCLGVLIEKDIVLTSGSCAEGINTKVGITLKNNSPKDKELPHYRVRAAIAHPWYTKWSKNGKPKRNRPQSGTLGAKDFDLGIIFIDIKNKPAPILPIKLKLDDGLTEVNKKVMAVTWYLKDNQDHSAGLDDYTTCEEKKVLDQEKRKIYGSTMKPKITFCIVHHTFEEGLVEYELGAPILSYKNNEITLLGIYSEGRDENRVNLPSKVTKVSGLINWIERVTKRREFFTKKAYNKIGDEYHVYNMKPTKGDKFAKVGKDDMSELDIPA